MITSVAKPLLRGDGGGASIENQFNSRKGGPKGPPRCVFGGIEFVII